VIAFRGRSSVGAGGLKPPPLPPGTPLEAKGKEKEEKKRKRRRKVEMEGEEGWSPL